MEESIRIHPSGYAYITLAACYGQSEIDKLTWKEK